MNILRIAKSYLLNLTLVLLSVVLMLAVIEGGTRLYLAFSSVVKFTSHIDFRKSKPPPYAEARYDVAEFTAESFALPGWKTPAGTRLLLPIDFSGKYINIKSDRRLTTDQPQFYRNKIYIFGGSTVFCNEVPDGSTIASALQRAVNYIYPNTYRVENLGATSVVASQQLERLKTIKLNKSDLVIFFDGANDSYNSIYRADPSGWILGENKQIVFDKGRAFEQLLKIHATYGKYSKFIDYFLSPYDFSYEPAHLKNKIKVDALSKQLEKSYRDSILGALDYSEKSGAKFIHFLQPTLFNNTKSLWYRHQLTTNPYLTSNGIEFAMSKGYAVLHYTLEQLKTDKVVSFDLSQLSETSQLDSIHFLDWVHVADAGNKILADEIFKRVDATGLLTK